MPAPLFAPRRIQTAGGPPDVPAHQPGDRGPGPEAPRRGASSAPRLAHGYAREAAALVLLATALFSALALASLRCDPMRPEVTGPDWVGPVGALAAHAGVDAVGIVAWLFPIELGLLAAPLLNGRPSIAGFTRIAGDVVVVFILAALAEVAFPHATAFGAMPLGGAVGELFGEVLRTLFSTIGSYIIGLTIVALILIGRATFSFIEWVKRIERAAVALGDRSAAASRALVGAWAAARAIDEKRGEDARRVAPRIAKASSEDAIIAALTEEEGTKDPDPPGMEIAVAAGEGLPPPLFERERIAPADAPAPAPPAPPALETTQKPRRTRQQSARPRIGGGVCPHRRRCHTRAAPAEARRSAP